MQFCALSWFRYSRSVEKEERIRIYCDLDVCKQSSNDTPVMSFKLETIKTPYLLEVLAVGTAVFCEHKKMHRGCESSDLCKLFFV
jgi:hypothetical protein